MQNDFSKSYFDLFGLEKKFSIPQKLLDRAYRDIQSQIHPDKFSHAGEAEKRLSMQWATRANEAYQTLKKPLSRARYLLQLHGVDTQEETNTAMPTDFLIEQMEWREAVIESKFENNYKSLISLKKKLYVQQSEMLMDLERLIDTDKDLTAACITTRKLRFLEKLAEEIDDAIESAENWD